MSEVYLAEDTKLDRKVALKFIPSHFTSDEKAVEHFKREACDSVRFASIPLSAIMKRVPIGASKARMGEFFSLRLIPPCGRDMTKYFLLIILK
ncbi:hypothetical protein ACFL5L_02265 [candidate division KSB1 bacterium]